MKITPSFQIDCADNRKLFFVEKFLYLFFLIFIALLFSVKRGIATKEFYIVSMLFIIYFRYNLHAFKNLYSNKVYLLSMILILYSVLSSMIVGSIEFDYIKAGLRLIVFLTIMSFFLSEKGEIFTLLKIIVVATVVGSGYDFFSYISSGGYQRSMPFGVDSKFLIQIYAGGIFSIVAIISVHLAFMDRNRIEKILYSLSCVYLSTLVYLSQSRAAILCYFFSIMIYLLLCKKVKIKHGLITLLTFSLIVGVVNSHIYKFTSLLARKDSGRLEIWSLSQDILKENFLFGHGLGEDFLLKTSVGSFTEPHNLYLYAIFTGGLICFLLLLTLYRMAIKAILDNWCPDLGPFMAAILLFIITFNFFDSRRIVDDIGVGWHLFWFPIGLIAAFASLKAPVNDEVKANNPE